MRFIWDEAKNVRNQQAHGISFEQASALFTHGDDYLEIFDETHSYDEDRFIAIGRSLKGRPMFVAFTIREKDGERFIRPVSARYMHKKESERYEEAEGA